MAIDLDGQYGYTAWPSSLLNSIFKSTVNMAAEMLVSVASSSKADNTEKWRPTDHLRFMVMLTTWLMVWVLRFLMDHFPCSRSSSPDYLLGGLSSVGPFQLASYSSPSTEALSSSGSSLNLILHDRVDGPSFKALERALTHILALLNEIPASSRKYQFTMAMADKIMEDNARNGHPELLHVNRMALGPSFTCASALIYHSYKFQSTPSGEDGESWHMRAIKAIPFGSSIAYYMKGISICFNAAFSWFGSATGRLQRREPGIARGDGQDYHGKVMAEKLAQELLWITKKHRSYGDINEALVQWSFASAILFGERTRNDLQISRQVKFRLLGLWIPLFCHASNGLCYPVLTSFQKAELERAMDEVISSFPAMDQEVILTNWIQEYAVSVSDWPNLRQSYDRWCQFTRELIT
ncbi:uncharacterized protein LOC111281618 [Durio zibethinus]|uniref:Uncharacterized protein LOC111281618 n=1 Tax=Durio zibethinus TaxID=66656 RepID=A0A6P5X9W9_DURZI|nr:uncharacterized protein LOC111281618 [Durio zibethinus]